MDALREAIISGGLRPGAKIVELDLSAQFGVSRGPIREAIRELVEEGLLESRAYAGTQVSMVDEAMIIDAYGLRRVLEVHAIKLCWPRRDERFRRSFEDRHRELLLALDKNRFALEIRAEVHFHSIPYEFSGSDLLLKTWRQISQKIQLGFLVYQIARGAPDFRDAHSRYVDLALGDDLPAMIAETERHIDLGLDTIKAFLEEKRKEAHSLERFSNAATLMDV